MKRNAVKLVCALLLVSMLLMLGGCDSSEKDALIGTWTGEFDLTDTINTVVVQQMDEEFAQYLQAEEFKIIMSVTFNEDDTYATVVDEQSVRTALEGYMEVLRAGMEEYFADMLAAEGIDMEELDMTLDDVLAASGMSMDDILAEAFNEDVVDEMFASMNQEGNFKAKDGKLYMSDGKDYAVDKNQYETYTIEGSVLTLVEPVSTSDVDEMVKTLYPMSFEKAE